MITRKSDTAFSGYSTQEVTEHASITIFLQYYRCYHCINGQVKHSYQYGVPMNDFLLAIVAVICADTPKSAIKKKRQKQNDS